MKWIQRLNSCIDYIEENIRDEISIEQLCEMSCLSRMYFFRMFEAACDVSLANYIKRRRMTLAVAELKNGRKVIDVAFDYGYKSPESFSRSFNEFHGTSPSSVKESKGKYTFYPRMKFSVSISGGDKIEYRIVDREKFELIGISIISPIGYEERKDPIVDFWKSLYEDKSLMSLLRAVGVQDEGGEKYGLCCPIEGREDCIEYAVAIGNSNRIDTEYKQFNIPKSKWAVFNCVGPLPESIQKAKDRILSEWLPSNEYEIACHIPQMEFYTRGHWNDSEYLSEIWIPIL